MEPCMASCWHGTASESTHPGQGFVHILTGNRCGILPTAKTHSAQVGSGDGKEGQHVQHMHVTEACSFKRILGVWKLLRRGALEDEGPPTSAWYGFIPCLVGLKLKLQHVLSLWQLAEPLKHAVRSAWMRATSRIRNLQAVGHFRQFRHCTQLLSSVA
eukprot:s240_g8.t1